MMTSSGEDNGPWEYGSAYRQKKKTKAEQETAQPTAARFNKYFVGTWYDKAWALGMSIMGNDAARYIRGSIACDIHLGLRNQPSTFGWCQVSL